MKKIALFDIDQTIYKTHSFFEIINYLVKEKIIPEEILLKVKSVLEDYKNKRINYSDASKILLSYWAKSLKNKSVTQIENKTKDFFLNNKDSFFSYWLEIYEILNKDYDIYIVTTNTQFVAKAITEIFNLKGFISSIFEEKLGFYTGEITRDLSSGKGMVSQIINSNNFHGSFAVGDSINDEEMLNKVEKAFCINPDLELKHIAEINNWRIISPDKAFDSINEFIS